MNPHLRKNNNVPDQGQDQGQDQDQAQGHEKVRQRSALLQLQMALSLVLALTLVLALVRNIIFSKVRVLVLNQPIKGDDWRILRCYLRSLILIFQLSTPILKYFTTWYGFAPQN